MPGHATSTQPLSVQPLHVYIPAAQQESQRPVRAPHSRIDCICYAYFKCVDLYLLVFDATHIFYVVFYCSALFFFYYFSFALLFLPSFFYSFFFFLNDPAPPEISPFPLPAPLPI